jgi:prevent-host-death family protein
LPIDLNGVPFGGYRSPSSTAGGCMKTLKAKDAKNRFGHLIDLARAEPVAVSKHGLPVVVVISIEEFDRLKTLEHSSGSESG